MRLIDADALDLDREVEMADDWNTAHEMANLIKYAPTIEAVPVVHGNKMQDFNNDLIRRTDALNMVHNFFLAKIKAVSGDREEIPMGELDPFLKDNKELSAKIKSIPNFEAVPVHGEWIEVDNAYFFSVRCSKCDSLEEFKTNFCPNCGAKMDGKAV